jgi:hypothetical protein
MSAHRWTALNLRRGVRFATLAIALAAAAPATGATLWDQTGHKSTRGTPSSNNTALFSSYAADDFFVPNGQRWRIRQVDVEGSFAGAALPHGAVASFYTSSKKRPSEAIAGDSIASAGSLSDPAFSIPIDPAITLRGGRTYWLLVYANEAAPYTDNQWFWTDRTVQSGNPAVWSAGAGFGSDCTSTFAPRASVCGIDPTAPDQVFKLEGKAVLTAP